MKKLFAALIGAVLLVTAAPALAASGGSPTSASNWKAYTYNASGQAFSSKVADRSGSEVAAVTFPSTPDLALLTTDHPSNRGTILGNIANKTLSTQFEIVTTGVATFSHYPTPCDPGHTYVRFYFASPGGQFDETQYWWSNATSVDLAAGSFSMSEMVDGSKWSDYNGHYGDNPLYSAGFAKAASDAQTIGLSFGGGCFFENGVGTPTGGATLHLNSFTAS